MHSIRRSILEMGFTDYRSSIAFNYSVGTPLWTRKCLRNWIFSRKSSQQLLPIAVEHYPLLPEFGIFLPPDIQSRNWMAHQSEWLIATMGFLLTGPKVSHLVVCHAGSRLQKHLNLNLRYFSRYQEINFLIPYFPFCQAFWAARLLHQ